MQYLLCRINDDETTTFVSEHDSIVDGVVAGKRVVKHVDFDYSYGLYADDGIKVASFAGGRAGYSEWARRTGRLQDEVIHSLDDKYDHDVDMLVS